MLPLTAPRWGTIRTETPALRALQQGLPSTVVVMVTVGQASPGFQRVERPGARGKGEGTGEDKGTRGEKGEGRAGMWG